MDDVSAVRTEIKTWEREFKSAHGRAPSVQDIKDRPDIADKYKLYKRLSKQANASSANASSSASTSTKPLREDRRQTPPRSSHRPSTSSLLLSASKHRAVKTEASILTSNPFSPVKNKGKGRHYDNHIADSSADSSLNALPLLLSSISRTKSNPFATPSKPKPRAASSRKIPQTVLEEDPFPLIDSHTLAPSSNKRLPQQSQVLDLVESRLNGEDHTTSSGPLTAKPVEDAVTRARKRLRGEPVSPSPVKEKRARVGAEHNAPNGFARGTLFDALQAAQGEESDDEPVRRGMDEEFIGETPVKPRNGGSTFVKLFDEARPSSSYPQIRPKSSKPATRSKSAGSSLFAFGFGPQQHRSNGKQRASSPEDDVDMDLDDPVPPARTGKLKAPDFIPNGAAISKPAKSAAKSNRPLAKATIPGKSELFDDADSTASMTERVRRIAIKKLPSRIEEEDENPDDDEPPTYHQPTSSPPPLLPPSPPPVSANSSKYAGGKGKANAKGFGKKTKLLEQLAADNLTGDEADAMSDADSDEVKVKEIPWSWNAHLLKGKHDGTEGISRADDEEEAGSEPEYRPAPVSSPAGEEEERFEVNLPEHLRQVLALSPHEPNAKTALDDEERLARGLIYGRREGHYDPSRGGEIWGVGEVEEEDEEEFDLAQRKESRTKDVVEDDDWEGEPVPWEVGEL